MRNHLFFILAVVTSFVLVACDDPTGGGSGGSGATTASSSSSSSSSGEAGGGGTGGSGGMAGTGGSNTGGAAGMGGAGGDGMLCGQSANGAMCPQGLVCCYPCGIPDCDWKCAQPCDPNSPGCANGCPLLP